MMRVTTGKGVGATERVNFRLTLEMLNCSRDAL